MVSETQKNIDNSSRRIKFLLLLQFFLGRTFLDPEYVRMRNNPRNVGNTQVTNRHGALSFFFYSLYQIKFNND